MPHIADKLIKAELKNLPEKGYRLIRDDKTTGFGVQVFASGNAGFVFRYSLNGRSAQYVIGKYGSWTVARAREKAKELRRSVDDGQNPQAEKTDKRTAPSVADVAERFVEEHVSRKRPATQRDYKAMIANDILPTLGSKKVADVTFTDIDPIAPGDLQARPVPGKPRRRRPVEDVFAGDQMAMAHRQSCEGHRTQSGAQTPPLPVGRGTWATYEALARHEDQQAAGIIRLLLLTGARRGEVQAARWADFDLTAGVWTKPGATTKQRTEHRIPLSAPARQLLAELRARADDDAEFVFRGRGGIGHRVELKSDWAALCKAAKIPLRRFPNTKYIKPPIARNSCCGKYSFTTGIIRSLSQASDGSSRKHLKRVNQFVLFIGCNVARVSGSTTSSINFRHF